jgi:two-component system, sensor histidine kinase and response regulator
MSPELFVLREDARVLVADDDPILREFAASHLSTPSVTVETAVDGEDAWARLMVESFDIALIDLGMPRLDGFGLIERVRATPRLANLPIVVITGREDMAAIDRAYRLGATSFVVKPLNWRLLSHQLGYVLRSSRNEDILREAREVAVRADAVKAKLLRLMRHELNTPFNAILGFGRLIETHAPDEASRSHAAQILAAARRFRATLDDISSAGHLLADELSPRRAVTTARELLRSSARAALERAGSAVDLVVRDRTGGADILIDIELTSEAVRRLIVNGFQHGAAPVSVTASLEADGALTIEVTDAGTGFDPAIVIDDAAIEGDLPQSSRGLGVGLAVARACCSAQGGWLDLQRSPGGGAVAAIRLPGVVMSIDALRASA